jgi:hypothetical protein
MANSYKLYTGDNSQTTFTLSGIDGWVSTAFIKVYLNDVLQTTGFSFVNMATTPAVQFGTAPASGVNIRLQRETARGTLGDLTLAQFQSLIIDFNDGSVLTSGDLDRAVQGLVHVAQESNDSGSGALGLNITQTAWTAGNKPITNLTDGTAAQDAVTVNQFNLATLFGGSAMQPELWSIAGSGATTYTLSPAPSGLNEDLFFVTIDGVVQPPSAYSLTPTTIVFGSAVASPKLISIRNLGVARSLVSSVQTAMIVDANVTTAKLNDSSVTAAKLDSNSVTTSKITDANVTYAKIQNVTPDKLLGRVTAGSGVVEEITCTPLAQTFLTKTSQADQRTALQLQPLAIKTTVGTTDIDDASVTYAKMQGVTANRVLGAEAVGSAPVEIPCTPYGRTLLNTTDAVALRTGLSIDPIYELRQFTTNSATITNHITIDLVAGGAYDTLYQEFIIACTFATSSGSPTTCGQDVVFTNLSGTRQFLVQYNLLSRDSVVPGGVPIVSASEVVTKIVSQHPSGATSYPIAGHVTLLPVPVVVEQVPEVWTATGVTAQTIYPLSSMLTTSIDSKDYLVTLDGVTVAPSAYTAGAGAITFTTAPTAGQAIVVRTFNANKTFNMSIAGYSYVYTNTISVRRIV